MEFSAWLGKHRDTMPRVVRVWMENGRRYLLVDDGRRYKLTDHAWVRVPEVSMDNV